jgi:hypothetical protein
MHVSYEVFSEKVNKEMFFGINIPNSKLESVRELIDKLKEINKKDPGFIYTCTRPEFWDSTTWNFSYTVKECYEQAKTLAVENIKEERKKEGGPEENMYNYNPFFETGCSCPFL